MKDGLLGALRRLRISATLAAIVYLALGIFLILAPDTAYSALGFIIALCITLYGALNVLSFLISREQSVYTFDLLAGVCALAFGIFSLIKPTFLLNFLLIVLGLMGVVGGIGGISRALNLRAAGYPRWAFPLVPGVLMVLVALGVVFMPSLYGSAMMMVVGVMLAVEAVSDLFSLYQLSHLTRI